MEQQIPKLIEAMEKQTQMTALQTIAIDDLTKTIKPIVVRIPTIVALSDAYANTLGVSKTAGRVRIRYNAN